jgi:branched-chain amino acid transport system permease protein
MKERFIWLVIGALAIAPMLSGNRYVLHVATMITILIPLALSVNLTLRLGQLSLAQPAFMGIGAYTSALLAMHFAVPSLLAVLAGGLLATIIAMIVGPIFLRIKGVYFVLLTYSFGQIINLNFQHWTSLFGGNNGLYGIPKFTLFGLHLSTLRAGYYILGLLVALAAYLGMRHFEKSDTGMICDALNEDELLCLALGSNAHLWRIAAFACGALMAAISGGIYAFYIGFISPDTFDFQGSVDLIVMNVIGGASSVLGPVIGAMIVVPLLEALRDARQYQLLMYGLCLLFFMMFFRKGLVVLINRQWKVGDARNS